MTPDQLKFRRPAVGDTVTHRTPAGLRGRVLELKCLNGLPVDAVVRWWQPGKASFTTRERLSDLTVVAVPAKRRR